jgi:hypothetical protein
MRPSSEGAAAGRCFASFARASAGNTETAVAKMAAEAARATKPLRNIGKNSKPRVDLPVNRHSQTSVQPEGNSGESTLAITAH